MTQAMLNEKGFAANAGEITVYHYNSETREYLSSSVEFLAVGVGVPAQSCVDAPPGVKAGFAVCRTASLDGWEYLPDHRGETVYSTVNGQAVGIDAPGDYSAQITPLAPATAYDRWDGSQWVTDEAAQKNGQVAEAEQHKAALLTEAKSTISLWQTELQLGIISEEDKTNLKAWMEYIQSLRNTDTAAAPDISWPQQP